MTKARQWVFTSPTDSAKVTVTVPKSNNFVGQSVVRVDGASKVSGRARYIDDLTLPGMIYGATVRSEIPRGKIRGLRFDPWISSSGAVTVTAREVPDNVVALIEDDQPILAMDVIRHAYEPIALVATERREDLARAVASVHVDVEPLRAVLDIDDSLGCRDVIYGRDNIQKRYAITRGEVSRARAAAQAGAMTVLRGVYSVHHQEHVYIEPQGVIAWWDPEGVHVMGSLQCPYYVHKALKRAFGLHDHEVHVTQTVTGGGFGGKEEYPSVISAHAALLSRKAKRPVKLIYGRAEDFEATTKRHPARVTIESGVHPDGSLGYLDIDIVMDGGAYVTLTPVVLSRGTLHATGPYRCPDVAVRARAVATNTPPNGAFRGFGAPQTLWAIERHIDKIAAHMKLDPLQVRRRNLLREGDSTATGQVLKSSVGGFACLDAALKVSGYQDRRHALTAQGEVLTTDGRRVRKGIGLATFFHGGGFTGSGEARLKGKVQVDLEGGGRLRVRSASTDIGQGTETVFAQIAAQAAKIPFDRVAVEQPCTTHVPDSGPTVASRTVMVVGSIVDLAARDVVDAVRADVARTHRIAIEAVVLTDDGYTGPFGRESFAEAGDRLLAKGAECVSLRQYDPPGNNLWNDETYSGDAYPVFSWGCDVAEVEVDLDTFETRVTGFWAAQDVGKAIHPVMCAGQVEGGSLQAIGWALSEEVVWQDGLIKNARFTNYIIPTSLDAPPFETVLVEVPYEGGPSGAKGVGELPMDGGAPAVAAAVEHAIGVSMDSLPMSPERLYESYAMMAAQSDNGGSR